MTSSPAPLAIRERAALADLLDAVGPDAPTCCEGWTSAHLAAHLVVRDRRPDAGPGYALETLPIGKRLHAHSARLEEEYRTRTPFAQVVAAVRTGPPKWTPMGIPALSNLVNAGEYAIHHEDLRRAQPGWEPRDLPQADRDQLWRTATLFARRVRRGLVLRRTDVPGVEKRIGKAGTTLAGDPMELLLWTSGRTAVARVEQS
ncbi:TIGR03085 family metal-binding protein [Trujillonella endophytica]|uniref:TIGR03085 family protein n=1 Tax=Trujillonella endophytica TaxID=673521 RepID=A0A1H8U0P4_9ACTN|nr:TIGR03085 family metal-binding protein [Trujillella endophytica]SEO96809.1 TIGR03085 family protein [Trujillella endophytica]